MSSSSTESCYSRAVIRKRASVLCSTPVQHGRATNRLSSISLSAVDPSSSSSTQAKLQPNKTKTVENYVKKKQGTKRQKREAKPKRKKRFKALVPSDSDWETKSEQSVHEEVNSEELIQQNTSAPGYSVLFKDTYGSPERIREAVYSRSEYRLESPVIGLRQREIESPKEIDCRDGLLPFKDLSNLRTRLYDEEDIEEELILKRQSTVRTYSNKKQSEQPRIKVNVKNIEEHRAYPMFDRITMADLLWDKFVKDNYEKVKKYLALE